MIKTKFFCGPEYKQKKSTNFPTVRSTYKFLIFVMILNLAGLSGCKATRDPVYIFGDEKNDLVQILKQHNISFILYDDVMEMVEAVPRGGGVMVLADHRSEERRVGKECRSGWWQDV